MLKGLYSNLSYGGKLLLLVILLVSFLLFSTLLAILLLVPFYGPQIFNLVSNPDLANSSVVNALKVIQIINMALGLLFPAMLYAWLCTPDFKKYTGLKLSSTPVLLLLGAFIIIVAQPAIGWTNELNSHLKLPPALSSIENWMRNAEDQGKLLTDAFLNSISVTGLIVNVFMIAILPAIAEEFLFRGVLANLFKDWTKNIHIAVLLSALIFAAIHLQFYGFLPRFLLGIILGYLFFWSGSLWVPVAAHFTNNFLSVLIEFMYHKAWIGSNAENFGNNASWGFIVISFLAVGVILFVVRNRTLANQTQVLVEDNADQK